jgi:probable F420-dependent oxidoreductase
VLDVAPTRVSNQYRLGYTLPFENLSLAQHPEVLRKAEDLGYTDAWTGEVNGLDGFTPLAVAAMSTSTTRLGTAIVSTYTRGPALLAMTAAAMSELAPSRFCLGVGASSKVIVENWNSGSFDRPWSRVRDTTAILRAALEGEKVAAHLDTLNVDGFRLARPPETKVPIFIAALQRRMLELAGRIGNGVILNWISPDDLPQMLREIHKGEDRSGRDGHVEVVCRVFVCPGERGAADLAARRHIAAYLNVPVYREFHEWLGRGELLRPMNEAWAQGDRREATRLIPQKVVDDLVIAGSTSDCRAAIDRYWAAGVDTVILDWLPTEESAPERLAQILESLWDLAPRSAGLRAASGAPDS